MANPFLHLLSTILLGIFMGHPAQRFSDRFQLQLSNSWQQWFNQTCHETQLPGFFRSLVDLDGLCATRPTQIWSGFMLPDSLPILGNGYGDWICARVDQSGAIHELVHWYHGGGDWIPVGNNLAEAIIHDAVDSHRPVRKQMLRGAIETNRPKSPIHSNTLLQWLVGTLDEHSKPITAAKLDQLLKDSNAANYTVALREIADLNIAVDAAACDCVEQIIQQALPSENSSMHMLSEQDCQQIIQHCESVLQRRQDLGWCYSLLGWCRSLNGDKEAGRATYFNGRFAPAFSDQSVRLRLHRFEQRYGKFSIAQLAASKSNLPAHMLEDSYLSTCLEKSDKTLVCRVQDYWLGEAQRASAAGNHASAYQFAFNAGWDIGAANMASYRKILDLLYHSAASAGWPARAAIAKAHIDAI